MRGDVRESLVATREKRAVSWEGRGGEGRRGRETREEGKET